MTRTLGLRTRCQGELLQLLAITGYFDWGRLLTQNLSTLKPHVPKSLQAQDYETFGKSNPHRSMNQPRFKDTTEQRPKTSVSCLQASDIPLLCLFPFLLTLAFARSLSLFSVLCLCLCLSLALSLTEPDQAMQYRPSLLCRHIDTLYAPSSLPSFPRSLQTHALKRAVACDRWCCRPGPRLWPGQPSSQVGIFVAGWGGKGLQSLRGYWGSEWEPLGGLGLRGLSRFTIRPQ